MKTKWKIAKIIWGFVKKAWTFLKPYLKKAAGPVTTGLIFAIAASIMSSCIMRDWEAERQIEEQLDNLSRLYIGCSKEWLNDSFGTPQFSGQKNDFSLYAYVTKHFLVQVALDESNAARAYLITALETDDPINWEINDKTIQTMLDNRSLKLSLGNFSYSDFSESPEKVFGFVSNGNSRALYAEYYYFMAWGNYYDYYLASLDFGKTGKTIEGFIREFGMPEDHPFPYYSDYCQIIEDRSNNCPNSYGVSDGVDVTDLFFTYDWFNSDQLRNQSHPSEPYIE